MVGYWLRRRTGRLRSRKSDTRVNSVEWQKSIKSRVHFSDCVSSCRSVKRREGVSFCMTFSQAPPGARLHHGDHRRKCGSPPAIVAGRQGAEWAGFPTDNAFCIVPYPYTLKGITASSFLTPFSLRQNGRD